MVGKRCKSGSNANLRSKGLPQVNGRSSAASAASEINATYSIRKLFAGVSVPVSSERKSLQSKQLWWFICQNRYSQGNPGVTARTELRTAKCAYAWWIKCGTRAAQKFVRAREHNCVCDRLPMAHP